MGAQLGAPAIWMLPVTFPVVMAFGGFLGLIGVPIPGVEIGIALSRRGIAAQTSGLTYSIGFVVATGLLHGCGIGIGTIHRWRLAVVLLSLFWLLGGALGGLPHAPIFTPPSWAPFMVVGASVAADLRLPIGATGALIAALGLVLGHPNGLAMAESGQGLRSVVGSAAAIFVVVTLVAALCSSNHHCVGQNRLAGRPKLDRSERDHAALKAAVRSGRSRSSPRDDALIFV